MSFFYQPVLLPFEEYQKLDRGNRLVLVLDAIDDVFFKRGTFEITLYARG